MLKTLLNVFFCICIIPAFSQEVQKDTIRTLSGVTIKGALLESSLVRSPYSIGVVSTADLANTAPFSLLPSLNNLSGVRMEERSPGSYRLSIRGSLLRSPFGVRNIKIYADDFSLTDAGGNTYLNLLDQGAASSIEVYKGPVSSIYGANTGGAISFNLPESNDNLFKLSATGGSFGALSEQAEINNVRGNFTVNIRQAYQQLDGYREHSSLNRHYIQVVPVWNYAEGSNLKMLAFYADMQYETPGGLTETQFSQNAKSARPSTPTIPGAITQQAGIFNKSIFTGIANTTQINEQWKFVAAGQFMHTGFINPFITNYERRTERSFGIRSYVTYRKKTVRLDVGTEISGSFTDISNSTNVGGIAGILMAHDRLSARQVFLFSRFSWDVSDRLHAEVSLSANDFNFSYRTITPLAGIEQSRSPGAQLMPNIALSYQLVTGLALRGSVSRGFSPPTIAELRASDAVVSTQLNAEQGYNFEMGVRISRGPLFVDLSVYAFRLQNAIVRRVNAADNEFFVNAGGTDQRGFESGISYVLPFGGPFKSGKVSLNYTYNDFSFRNYVSGQSDFSGNRLTGTPRHVGGVSTEGDINGFRYYLNYQSVSSIWLNDANTAKARPYQMLEAKLRKQVLDSGGFKLEVNLGGENLLDQQYSLGNDLNAVGGRFFNAAPGRSFYAGVTMQL